jgi:hypothetical protein
MLYYENEANMIEREMFKNRLYSYHWLMTNRLILQVFEAVICDWIKD